MMKYLKYTVFGLLFLLCAFVLMVFFYMRKPPELGRLSETSQVIRSENGEIINLRLTSDGYWREKARLEQIDPELVDMLIAYEDKRFWSHVGVDPFAVARASFDFVRKGRIVSGSSTISMQLVRLLDPSLAKRTVPVKLRQMLEALRIEAHWSKAEILEAYFSIAPYGGNIEGVIAASHAWLNKDPLILTASEMALLVALPQSPEARRPDLHPERAQRAKQYVLERVANELNLKGNALTEAKSDPLPSRLAKPTSVSLHLGDRLSVEGELSVSTTIDSNWQKDVTRILSESVIRQPAPINGAAMVIERKTGLVKAYVGSSDYLNSGRKGGINYLTAIRSPGSTLKPLIYAKALDRNLISHDEIFDDQELHRGTYTPTNFDEKFNGKVKLKDALLRSLNIPALLTLEKLSPQIVENELNSFIGKSALTNQSSGLSLAVGGYYVTAEQLAQIYLGIIDPSYKTELVFNKSFIKKTDSFELQLLSQNASHEILDLLIQDLPNGETAAFKTGTSFNRQDSWCVQIFENHLVLVWLGTPDNQPTEHLTGRDAAFPITHEIGRTLGLAAPKKPNLRKHKKLEMASVKEVCAKLIEFPQNGSWIRTDNPVIKVAGKPDASWYLNGEPIAYSGKQLPLKSAGVHRLTARTDNCSETNEFFVEIN